MFQSTLPTRGSDSTITHTPPLYTRVSIHAPHEGERQKIQVAAGYQRSFNPRSPRGGATAYGRWQNGAGTRVSIHAPHEGERLSIHARLATLMRFNPRSPRGGATYSTMVRYTQCSCFNPRSPRGGATHQQGTEQKCHQVSIHAPHEGERRSVAT